VEEEEEEETNVYKIGSSKNKKKGKIYDTENTGPKVEIEYWLKPSKEEIEYMGNKSKKKKNVSYKEKNDLNYKDFYVN
jgi:hypothetical protein